MTAVSSPRGNLITIQRNEWAEVESVDGRSRIIETLGVGSDFVTILVHREYKWAIMVRTGLDTNVTATFTQVLQRAKVLSQDSFQGIAVKTIGGQPQYGVYCHAHLPLDKIKELSNNQISDDNLRALPGREGQVYEGIEVNALDGKTKLGQARYDAMECTPTSAKETQGTHGWITAKKVPEQAEEAETYEDDFVLL